MHVIGVSEGEKAYRMGGGEVNIGHNVLKLGGKY